MMKYGTEMTPIEISWNKRHAAPTGNIEPLTGKALESDSVGSFINMKEKIDKSATELTFGDVVRCINQ